MDSKKMIAGLMAVNVLLGAACYKKATFNEEDVELPTVEVEVVNEVAETTAAEEVIQVRPESIDDIDIRTFRVTAYCPCEICCGKWAKNRPLDENGEVIVVGSNGVELVNEFSAAGTLEFGTQVELDGIGTVEIQDRPANWVINEHGNDIIDIYMTDHDTAFDFGVKYVRGVVK